MLKKFYLLSLFLVLLSISLYSHSANSSGVNYANTVKEINRIGDNLISQYHPKDGLTTMDGFSTLYFDHYEASGMELAVMTISPSSNTKTEALFTQLIGSASNEASPSDLKKIWSHLKDRLEANVNLIQKKNANNFPEAFLQSFTILLREGFEALLIVTALLTYLRRSKNTEKTRVIYYGVGLALIASAVTAYLFATFFKTAGSNREAMEGIVMLIAAGVLFYVSYWLFAKREAEKWQQYIKQKIHSALSTGSMFALGSAAFLAVYREGAETILFYQALLIGNKSQSLAILCGFITACFALVLVYRIMQTASYRIPFRIFFTITAVFLYYMAFYFIGGGILELQEAGWVKISPIPGFPQIAWLGIFPTWQNISAQLAFLIPTLGGLIWWHLRSKKRLPQLLRNIS